MRFALCALRFALCALRFALCALRFAICDLRFAICALRSALCALRSALCALRFALCALRFALCALRFAICDLRFAICDLQYAIRNTPSRFQQRNKFTKNHRRRAPHFVAVQFEKRHMDLQTAQFPILFRNHILVQQIRKPRRQNLKYFRRRRARLWFLAAIQGFRLVVISSGFARNLAGQNEISRSARNDKRKS